MKLFRLDSTTGKCLGCNWEKELIYVLADSKAEAVELLKNEDAGLCGDCICDMLSEKEYEISQGK